jgi:prepilin-type N-terminal cleavage/methylation domain-containing protein
MNKKAFTLIELLVVISIVTIIAAIAIPSISGICQEKSTAIRFVEEYQGGSLRLITDKQTKKQYLSVYNRGIVEVTDTNK